MITAKRDATVLNQLGLHARPASEFVRCAQQFAPDTDVYIRRGEESFSAMSILEVLTANLDCGATLSIEAAGPRAQEAVDTLADLVAQFPKEDAEEGKG